MEYSGPVVLAILDGVGLAPDSPGNAVSRAKTPFLARAVKSNIHLALDASGEAVGLEPGQVGNSEVGHITLGAGRAIKQDLVRVNEAFNSGEVFKTNAWETAIGRVVNGDDSSTLHFAGIFSDGGVHSHISHLEQMVEQAYLEGVRKIRVHAVFDGRDTPPQSEPKYILRFKEFAKKFPGADIKIASGGGRQTTVADRYESNWQVVARGWDMMVNGRADYYFKSPEEAIEVLRRIKPDIQDQDLPAFVVVDDDERPVGTIKKGDTLIYFDFRKDRAIEIAMAFVSQDFPYFNRGAYKPEDVYFVGMTEYNSDTHIPEHRLVEPIRIDKTLNRFLGAKGVSDFAISETIKYGHITYYFNGNSYERAPGEDFLKIENDSDAYVSRPWMKIAEITDAVIERMPNYKFIRLNYPNGDMLGHTANIEATTIAMEAIDLSLERLAVELDKLGGMMIIVSDHGNAEEMLSPDGKPRSSHSLNKVPCIFYDNTENRKMYTVNDMTLPPSIEDIASTVALLLGLYDYPDEWEEPLIKIK